MNENNIYDYIYIGSSPLAIIDAASKKIKNKNILLIENKSYIGGSWASLNIFGYKEVENAIHYFLPSKKGIQFMKNNLKWNIVRSNSKYRVLNKKIFNKKIYKYDNPIGKIMSKILDRNFINILSLKFIFNLFNKSYYLSNGSKEIIRFCKNIINEDKIDILYEHEVENIFINTQKSHVELKIKNLKNSKEFFIKSRILNITHGLKISEIDGDKGKIKFNPLIELRPHIHLLVKEKTKKFDELIFDNNKFIKYIHEVSQYLDKDTKSINDEKIYILALRPEIINNIENIKNIINEMLKINVLTSNHKYVDHIWTDIYLPELSDNDLQSIDQKYNQQIQIMLTENFSKSIELYHSRWYERFR